MINRKIGALSLFIGSLVFLSACGSPDEQTSEASSTRDIRAAVTDTSIIGEFELQKFSCNKGAFASDQESKYDSMNQNLTGNETRFYFSGKEVRMTALPNTLFGGMSASCKVDMTDKIEFNQVKAYEVTHRSKVCSRTCNSEECKNSEEDLNNLPKTVGYSVVGSILKLSSPDDASACMVGSKLEGAQMELKLITNNVSTPSPTPRATAVPLP